MRRKKLINKYIKNELSPQELEEFRQLCASDKDFAEEAEFAAFLYAQKKVEQKKHWQKLLKNKNDSTIKNTIYPKVKQLQPPSKTGPVWRMAAGFALVTLSITIFWFLNQQPTIHQMISTELATPYPAPVLTMNKVEATTWLTASRAYRERRFETVVMILENLESEHSLTAEESFYLGLSYLYIQPHDAIAALSHFEKSESIAPQLLNKQIKWFKSLALLDLGENKKAKILLTEIVQTNSWKNDKAAKLLKGL